MSQVRKSKLQFKRAGDDLRALDIYPEIYRRIMSGEASYSVAKWLKSLGHFAEIKEESLRKKIDRAIPSIQREVPPQVQATYLRKNENETVEPEIVEKLDESAEDCVEKLLESKEKPGEVVKAEGDEATEVQSVAPDVVDCELVQDDLPPKPVPPPVPRPQLKEVAQLEKAADMQWSRIKMLHENEKKIQHLFPQGRQEFSEYRAMLHTLIDKKRDLGIAGYGRRQPNITQNNTIIQGDVKQVTEQTMNVIGDPKARRKVLDVLRLFKVQEDDEDQKRLGSNDVAAEA